LRDKVQKSTKLFSGVRQPVLSNRNFKEWATFLLARAKDPLFLYASGHKVVEPFFCNQRISWLQYKL